MIDEYAYRPGERNGDGLVTQFDETLLFMRRQRAKDFCCVKHMIPVDDSFVTQKHRSGVR